MTAGPSTSEITVFVTRKGASEILVLLRADELGAFWHVVAGTVEANETPEHAAIRETREEIALEIEPSTLRRREHFTYSMPPRRDDTSDGARPREVDVTCFLVGVEPSYEPTLNWEHEDFQWCEIEDAISLLRWENVAQALRRLLDDPRK